MVHKVLNSFKLRNETIYAINSMNSDYSLRALLPTGRGFPPTQHIMSAGGILIL